MTNQTVRHPAVFRAATSASTLGLLDKLMNLVGELVLARNQILQHANTQEDAALLGNLATAQPDHHRAAGRGDEDPDAADRQHLEQVPARGARPGAGLRQASAGRDGGQRDRARRTIIEAIKDPLTHLVRNAVDHGIETPEERLRRGKPADGLPATARLSRGRPGQHRDLRRRRGDRPRPGHAARPWSAG